MTAGFGNLEIGMIKRSKGHPVLFGSRFDVFEYIEQNPFDFVTRSNLFVYMARPARCLACGSGYAAPPLVERNLPGRTHAKAGSNNTIAAGR